MMYRGDHRKYVLGTSNYEIYNYGDVVKRSGVFYVCGITQTYGYIPEEAVSGFVAWGASASSGGSITDYVRSFNGLTGNIIGVSSVDGATGAVILSTRLDGGTF